MALGLSTFLLSQHWPWERARGALVMFAAAAPAATLVTLCVLRALPILTSPSSVALAVIFSGGTLTYAATMHILPGVLAGGGHGGAAALQLAAVAAGCVAPLLLSHGHAH